MPYRALKGLCGVADGESRRWYRCRGNGPPAARCATRPTGDQRGHVRILAGQPSWSTADRLRAGGPGGWDAGRARRHSSGRRRAGCSPRSRGTRCTRTCRSARPGTPGRGPGRSIRNSAATPARDQYRQAVPHPASVCSGFDGLRISPSSPRLASNANQTAGAVRTNGHGRDRIENAVKVQQLRPELANKAARALTWPTASRMNGVARRMERLTRWAEP